MRSPLSFKRLLLQNLLLLTPTLTLAQSSLSSCLTDRGVANVNQKSPEYALDITPWQLRLKSEVKPLAVAYPTDKPQLASSLACARNASVKVSVLGGGHSFAAFGWGNPGDLVVSMAAFNHVSYDEKTTLLTVGGGTRTGSAMKFLWDQQARFFNHVRHGHVGVAGSLTGGGFGSTSRFTGIPMDSVESAEIMLYNGTVVNTKSHPDLLFAVKGAASSYGVITTITTKTFKPPYPDATNYTVTCGKVGIEDAVKLFLVLQDFFMTAPNEMSLRIPLTLTPFTAIGYYYGEPSKFKGVMQPLMSRFHINCTLAATVLDFWTMETSIAIGANLPNGGDSPGRSFYNQALTTAKPLTATEIHALFQGVILDFFHKGLKQSGLLDLWHGAPILPNASESAYVHQNNVWLIRFDTNMNNATETFLPEGIAYAKQQFKGFKDALLAAGTRLQAFCNYRDETLSLPEWSDRLYGQENFRKLKSLKLVYDPIGLFNANAQSIPLPG